MSEVRDNVAGRRIGGDLSDAAGSDIRQPLGDTDARTEPTGSDPRRQPGQVVLTGRLDAGTVSRAREVLHTALDAGQGPLFVDISAVEWLDVTGLGVLVGSQHRARHVGRRLVLAGTPPRIRRLLRVTGLERVLPTDEDHTAPSPRAGAGSREHDTVALGRSREHDAAALAEATGQDTVAPEATAA